MRACVVITLLVACSSAPQHSPVTPAAPPGPTAAPPPAAAWLTTTDDVFSIETPVVSAPGKNPHSWAAPVTDELAYLMMYLNVPGAATKLDNAVQTITGSMRSIDKVDTVTILGRPARRVAATTPAGRPAVEVFVADGDRLFMLQVIGAAPVADIERFLTSFRIR